MHRIRTWARAKAHGNNRVNSEPRAGAAARSGAGLSQSTSRASSKKQNNDGTQVTGDGPPVEGDAVPAGEGEKPKPVKGPVAKRFFGVVWLVLASSWINVLLVFVPVGIAAHFANLGQPVIFAMNAIAIIPLAAMLAYATESVSKKLGDTIGALMNVTFGNAVELIIFIIALVDNKIRIVQASLLGSILSNLLLILGMCFMFGGLRFREQIYNSTVTQMSACLLSLAVISLMLPTAFHASFTSTEQADLQVVRVSRGTSVILLLVYILYLVFQLNSHAYMYESTPQHVIDRESVPGPAAHYFDSSSSSESDSSSSDSDSSGHSYSTARRIKRAIKKGGRNRKASLASTTEKPSLTSIPASPAVETPTEPIERTTSEPAASSSQSTRLELSEDAVEALASNQDKKKKKKHKHRHSRKDDDQIPENGEPTVPVGTVVAATQAVDGANDSNTKRVDFALAPDLEAQTGTRPKPFSLRTLRPNLTGFPSTVFSPPPANVNGAPTGQQPPRPLRRTQSLPSQHQSYRTNAGALPPIVPIVVNSQSKQNEDEDDEPEISRTSAILLLLVSTALVALCAEFMVDAIDGITDSGGLSETFVGLILLPIVGNAAEHVTAVTVAMKNKMDLAIGVAIGSSIQIALFVTPLVVILGWMMDKDMSLYFTLFETISLFVSAFIVNFLVLDGRSNYLEGSLLCASYVIIALAAFFYPDSADASTLGGGDGNTTTTAEVVTKLAARGLATLWQ
ncbi:hypothetical protein N0V82_003690 [Gnomoniopsis sp. IMI 355080]|nr:hypothetical protein N0V82_003690 [Gnomoniopsis sp. IMI 355080]